MNPATAEIFRNLGLSVYRRLPGLEDLPFKDLTSAVRLIHKTKQTKCGSGRYGDIWHAVFRGPSEELRGRIFLRKADQNARAAIDVGVRRTQDDGEQYCVDNIRQYPNASKFRRNDKW